MSGKYDVESFINDIVSVVKAGLPAKITAINAEKSDANSIDDIPSAQYYDNMGEQVINHNVFIYYTILPTEPKASTGSATATEITLAFSVVFNNLNNSGTIQKVLRYTRCLKEVVQDAFDNNASHSNLKVTEFTPTDIELNQGSDFKIGGIQITSTIVG